MKYDQFLQEYKELGMVDLYLPSYFKHLHDHVMYGPGEIAMICSVDPESARRWFRQGKLPQDGGVSHYKCSGLAVKRFIFSKIWPKIEKRLA